MAQTYEYEYAVFCDGGQIVHFFESLLELGYRWQSETPLLRADGATTIVNAGEPDLFLLTHRKRVVHDSGGNTLSRAIDRAERYSIEHKMITYDEFVCNGNSFFPVQTYEIDVMSIL